VVARNDVEATFKSKLAQLGLNGKEITDFNDFWYQSSPSRHTRSSPSCRKMSGARPRRSPSPRLRKP